LGGAKGSKPMTLEQMKHYLQTYYPTVVMLFVATDEDVMNAYEKGDVYLRKLEQILRSE
jgi:hypothetical protein